MVMNWKSEALVNRPWYFTLNWVVLVLLPRIFLESCNVSYGVGISFQLCLRVLADFVLLNIYFTNHL